MNPVDQQIAYDVWYEKYRYKDERDYAATCERVTTALCEGRETQEFTDKVLSAMTKNEIVPAGRIMAAMGTDKRVTAINCLAGSERLLTKEYGAVSLCDVVGSSVTVLTAQGWRPATVREFGTQPLQEIVFRPAYEQSGTWRINGRSSYKVSVTATPDHRWLLAGKRGVHETTATTALREGDVVEACAYAPDERSHAYLEGLRHGLIFGDGSYYGNPRIGSVHGRERHHRHILRLCGRKAAHVAAFADLPKSRSTMNYAHVSCPPSADGDPIIAYYADTNCKELPINGLEDDYYGGFIDGWLAADGHVDKRGSVMLHSQNLEALDWVVDVGAVAGWLVSGRTVVARAGEKTNLGTRSHDMHKLTLRRPSTMKWKVARITPVGEGPVYCAVVPGPAAFTLACGVYTGNCFVSPDIQDSMRTNADEPGMGIMDALSAAAYTQQMSGGIGMGYSTLRPRGAIVRRTASMSSGVLPFMHMWDAMCATVRSSGGRRGAMMGTLGVWHPDIEEFIEAKTVSGSLTNFNVSVLVTDAFMLAVRQDISWDLHFPVPRADGIHVEVRESVRGTTEYVYKRVRARELWDKITATTFVHAEPGVIFIDRVNELNNLAYCEYIHCSNPCGEQMLPANGDCCLGHTNLAAMVRDPFTDHAKFDYSRLRECARMMTRLLDNVLDITAWPLEEQHQEAMNKRRIGLGVTGLGTALQMLGRPYGSEVAEEFVRNVARVQAISAYSESVSMAAQRGAFPLFDAEEFVHRPFVRRVAGTKMLERMCNSGIRNGVLLSQAPVGTRSLTLGNVTSGIEPAFAHRYKRNVRGPSGEIDQQYQVYDYGYLAYCDHAGLDPDEDHELPEGFVTADKLTVAQHLGTAAIMQHWTDSAVSKTINCPESMTLEEFRDVYTSAYDLGMKGCTTYRPDPRSGRGSILVADDDTSATRKHDGQGGDHAVATETLHNVENAAPSDLNGLSSKTPPTVGKIPMLDVADGRRYRIEWPSEDGAYYITITDYVDAAGQRRPFELFVNTKSAKHDEWIKAFSLMVTAIFRREGDPTFIVDELKSVFSATGGAWQGRRYVPSLVAAIGTRVEEHMQWLGMLGPEAPASAQDGDPLPPVSSAVVVGASACPRCGAAAYVRKEGCGTCLSCGHSDCG